MAAKPEVAAICERSATRLRPPRVLHSSRSVVTVQVTASVYRHVYRHGAQRYSGSHLTAVGLPVRWTAEHDAELVVLRGA
jgi:hypothetical protein